MLVIRLQRTGRKGHAQFRVVVQDSRRTPSSGKIVAALGHYNPHTKEIVVNTEKSQYYLDHGAQPSTRVAVLLKKEGVKLPNWVSLGEVKSRSVRNPEKRRSTTPVEKVAEDTAEAEQEEAQTDEEVTDDKTAE